MPAVVGVVRHYSDAEQIVQALWDIEVADRHISVLTPASSEAALRAIPTTETEQPGIGQTLGSVVGGAAGTAGGLAVASVAHPGVGAVIAAGAIAGLLGAVAGGAVGGQIDDTLPEGLLTDDLYVYRDALQKGRSIVIAIAEDDAQATQVRQLLAELGGGPHRPPRALAESLPQSGSSARFDESASTISSFSMTLICVVSCGRTSPTTTPCGHTNRLTTTVPNHESSNPRHVAGSSPSLRSAGSITATSARPDRERVQPPPRSRKPPDGGPPGSSQAAPSRICRWVAPLIPSRQERRRQVQRSTYRRGMRRLPMRFLTGTGISVPCPREMLHKLQSMISFWAGRSRPTARLIRRPEARITFQ